MEPVVIRARDGLPLVSYLSRPRGAIKSVPSPMLLLVHGGPWARDIWALSSTHQWLAHRGYAVLSVNFRGSTGLGKAFVNAANLEWAGKMHDDLIDGVNWAIAQGVADAIYGGSYGGYSALVGVTFTPEKFACAVDLFGISNLVTLMNEHRATVLEAVAGGLEGAHGRLHQRGGPFASSRRARPSAVSIASSGRCSSPREPTTYG